MVVLRSGSHENLNVKGIGLFILPRTWKLVMEAVDLLLEGTPADVNLASVREALCAHRDPHAGRRLDHARTTARDPDDARPVELRLFPTVPKSQEKDSAGNAASAGNGTS